MGIEQGPRDRLQLLIGQAREYLLAEGVLDRRELITDHFFELVADLRPHHHVELGRFWLVGGAGMAGGEATLAWHASH